MHILGHSAAHMTRRRIVLSTALVWLVAASTWEGLRIWVVLHDPPDGDLYANSLDFQLFASLFLIAAYWFPILAVVLSVEFLCFTIVDRRRSSSARRNGVPAA
jgi:hypothetical protein